MLNTEQAKEAAPSGSHFTDHMVTARYEPERGWSDLTLTDYQPLQLDPSTSVLHYGQAIFEGLKTYHQPDGSVSMFRPEQNARRFARSARALGNGRTARRALPRFTAHAGQQGSRSTADAAR